MEFHEYFNRFDVQMPFCEKTQEKDKRAATRAFPRFVLPGGRWKEVSPPS
jgi:hypothetical protein